MATGRVGRRLRTGPARPGAWWRNAGGGWIAGALATLLVVAGGCSSVFESSEDVAADVITLEVDALTAPCTGEALQTCLRVREPGDADWRLFYSEIRGFEHEPGYRYVIEVDRSAVADPPMDGASYTYRLIRVVSRERAG